MNAAPVRHLGCPACGATLTRREEERTVRCRACGNRSVLVGIEAAPRFQAVPTVDRDAAMAIVRRALRDGPVPDGLSESAAFVATDLFWVPYYEFETLQAGTVRVVRGVSYSRGGRVDWSTGQRRFLDPAGREIAESDYYRQRSTEDVDTSVVLRTHRADGPAAGPDDWGLGGVNVARLEDDPTFRLVPFGSPLAPRGHVLPPRRGRAEAEEDVRRVTGSDGGVRMDSLASELRFVFVPVWVVRLRVNRHPYTFVVDAVRARVLSGRAPEAPRRGTLFIAFAAAYLGFPIGKIAASLVASGAGGDGSGASSLGALAGLVAHAPVVLIGAAILLLFPLAFAWGEFRFRGEVVFGPAGARIEKLARPARTGIELVIDWLVAQLDRLVKLREKEW